MDVIIATKHVGKTYNENGVPVTALDDVSVEIKEREFLALVGPSGSGKTTLLNMIGGIDVPTSGMVRLDNEDLAGLSRSALSDVRLRKIGFVFQEYNLLPVLSAIENVEYPLILQGIEREERRTKALAVLSRLGLGELAGRRPKKLSGGQQQRVAVARAIVTNPRLVLADEPTANLDSKTGEALLDLMKELNERDGVTFVFSTHDPMVMKKAKRIIRLKDGIVADD
jgi:putative ABC transport system ATP-binding protein